MAEPFLGEIKIISWNFAPKGWSFCNGQLLPIAQNQALFSILGTTYGGDGRQTFALPDLRGRVPVHVGGSFASVQGQVGGQTAHTLTISEMPAHNHLVMGTNNTATSQTAPGNVLAAPTTNKIYTAAANIVILNPIAVTNTGGSQPHENMMPYTVLNFVIALQGIFPSQN